MHSLLTDLAQTIGLPLFIIGFVLVLIYALGPRNKDQFDRAAHTPLNEEETPRVRN